MSKMALVTIGYADIDIESKYLITGTTDEYNPSGDHLPRLHHTGLTLSNGEYCNRNPTNSLSPIRMRIITIALRLFLAHTQHRSEG